MFTMSSDLGAMDAMCNTANRDAFTAKTATMAITGNGSQVQRLVWTTGCWSDVATKAAGETSQVENASDEGSGKESGGEGGDGVKPPKPRVGGVGDRNREG